MLSSQFGNKHLATVNVDDEDEDTKREETLKTCCKNVIGFLFSTIGLCCLVFLYSVAGAVLFTALEQKNQEVRLRKLQDEAQDMHAITVNKIGSTCLRVDCVKNATVFSEEIAKLLAMAQVNARNVTERGWDGTFPGEETKNKWDFVNSLLFCITTITLIGYGHIVPKTPYGQLVTVAYALIGIPLTLLYLANIGSFMADLVRYVYHHLCCKACCTHCCKKCCNTEAGSSASGETVATTVNRPTSTVKLKRPPKRKGRTKGLPKASAMTSKSESNVRPKNKRSLPDASKSVRHINVNQNSRNKSKGKKIKPSPELVNWSKVKLTPLSYEKKNNGQTTSATSSTSEYSDPRNEVTTYGVHVLSSMGHIGHVQANTNNDTSLEEIRDQYLTWKHRYRYASVPVSLTLLMMISYIILGALIFTFWEGWTFMQAFYFTFVTLTTIGLGDFVPGFNKDEGGKSVVCGVYVLVGLALIAMSMDLMQYEVKTLLIHLAEKMGMVKKKTNKKQSDTETVFSAIHA